MPTLRYTETLEAAERYRKLARLHPNQFWAVYLLSCANMVTALADTRKWGREGLEIDDVEYAPVADTDLKQPIEARFNIDGTCAKKNVVAEMEALGNGILKGTHGSPELDADAEKLESLGADPGPVLDDILPYRGRRQIMFDDE